MHVFTTLTKKKLPKHINLIFCILKMGKRKANKEDAKSNKKECVSEDAQTLSAQVVAENQALQTENKQLKTQFTQHKQDLSKSRALVHALTFEVDELKTELTIPRWFA